MEELLATGGCIVAAVIIPLVLLLLRAVRLLYQYERGVVFTLGKYAGTRDPGLTFVIPILQKMR